MALTKAESLTRLRQRLRDTGVTYNFSDDLLYTYLQDAYREVSAAIRSVDGNFFLTSRTVNAYTDALDPAPSGASDPGNYYTMYPLPEDMASLRFIERADGSLHYKIWESSARDIEIHRYAGLMHGTLTLEGTTYTLPLIGGYERAAILGDRFRILPAPTAAGAVYGVWYERQALLPSGSTEPLRLPELFEAPLLNLARARAYGDDGDSLKAEALEWAAREMALAVKDMRRRHHTSAVLGAAF